jgi:hypothetical protein
VDRTHVYAGCAINAVVCMYNHLLVHLVEAGHRAYLYAVGELAAITFVGHNMHKISMIGVAAKNIN